MRERVIVNLSSYVSPADGKVGFLSIIAEMIF